MRRLTLNPDKTKLLHEKNQCTPDHKKKATHIVALAVHWRNMYLPLIDPDFECHQGPIWDTDPRQLMKDLKNPPA